MKTKKGKKIFTTKDYTKSSYNPVERSTFLIGPDKEKLFIAIFKLPFVGMQTAVFKKAKDREMACLDLFTEYEAYMNNLIFQDVSTINCATVIKSFDGFEILIKKYYKGTKHESK